MRRPHAARGGHACPAGCDRRRRAAKPTASRAARSTTPARRTQEGRAHRRAPDLAVDEAYDGLGATFAFFLKAYGRNSIDGAGMPLDATVHYGVRYDNAFWNGRQMVFGDGDGKLFNRFTIALDVIGHELTHGVTSREAGLIYRGQPGALNESLSDVFGALIKQYKLKQTADKADWLIGAGLFTRSVHGVAIRSMKAPGTAYDDRVLGKDPQPAHMSSYIDTTEDNGGVHLNSRYPEPAFYLAATALGSEVRKAGRIWYEACAIQVDCRQLATLPKYRGHRGAPAGVSRPRLKSRGVGWSACRDRLRAR
jgi:Zn-dependent metalloprotease